MVDVFAKVPGLTCHVAHAGLQVDDAIVGAVERAMLLDAPCVFADGPLKVLGGAVGGAEGAYAADGAVAVGAARVVPVEGELLQMCERV